MDGTTRAYVANNDKDQTLEISGKLNVKAIDNNNIETIVNGGELEQDWCLGMKEGAVVMTALNEDIAAEGTAQKLEDTMKAIKDGSLKVFDSTTFTVGGAAVTSSFALDTDGDFAPDSEEAVFDGAYHESYFHSAPYFALRIDGIEWINEAY